MKNAILGKSKNEYKLQNQVADFFDYIDRDSYTKSLLSSKKAMMRVLQFPYIWDICWNIDVILSRMAPWVQVEEKNELPIDRSNQDQIKQIVKQELIRQSGIEEVDMDLIRKEYCIYMQNDTKARQRYTWVVYPVHYHPGRPMM